MRTRRLFFLLICALCLILPVARASAEPNIEAWLREEPRLRQPVTIRQEKARIGEVLDKISEVTGVRVYASDRDGAAGEVITVFVEKMPAAELMASLWSLMSHKSATWMWVEEKQKNEPTAYRLTRPAKARAYAESVFKEVEAYAVETMEAAIQSLNASDAEIERLSSKFPEVAIIKSPEHRGKMKAFASLFPTPEQRREFFNGKETEIPASKWTPEMTAYAKSEYENFIAVFRANIPAHIPEPKPFQSVKIYRSDMSLAITPIVWMGLGERGGYPIVGGTVVRRHWNQQFIDRWLVSGDKAENKPEEARKLPPLPKTVPKIRDVPGVGTLSSSPDAPIPIMQRLKQLHLLGKLPILARVSGSTVQVIPALDAIALQSVLAHFRERDLLVKWRHGVLMVGYQSWIRTAKAREDGKMPWNALKLFRQRVMASPQRQPNLETVIALLKETTEAQLQFVEDEKSLMPLEAQHPTGFLSGVSPFQTMLVNLQKQPGLLDRLYQPGGVPLRQLPLSVRHNLPANVPDQLPPNIVLSLVENPQKILKEYPGFFDGMQWQLNIFAKDNPKKLIAQGSFTWPYTHESVYTKDEMDFKTVFGEPQQAGN